MGGPLPREACAGRLAGAAVTALLACFKLTRQDLAVLCGIRDQSYLEAWFRGKKKHTLYGRKASVSYLLPPASCLLPPVSWLLALQIREMSFDLRLPTGPRDGTIAHRAL